MPFAEFTPRKIKCLGINLTNVQDLHLDWENDKKLLQIKDLNKWKFTCGVHGLGACIVNIQFSLIGFGSNINYFKIQAKIFLEDKFVLKFIQKGKGPRKITFCKSVK